MVKSVLAFNTWKRMDLEPVGVPATLLSNWLRVGASRNTFATGAVALLAIKTSSRLTLAAPNDGEERYLNAI